MKPILKEIDRLVSRMGTHPVWGYAHCVRVCVLAENLAREEGDRSTKSGYKVVTVDPRTGKVTDFLTGFLRGQNVLGRPVDLVVARDGSLLLTDDGEGRVYRIQYTGN